MNKAFTNMAFDHWLQKHSHTYKHLGSLDIFLLIFTSKHPIFHIVCTLARAWKKSQAFSIELVKPALAYNPWSWWPLTFRNARAECCNQVETANQCVSPFGCQLHIIKALLCRSTSVLSLYCRSFLCSFACSWWLILSVRVQCSMRTLQTQTQRSTAAHLWQ